MGRRRRALESSSPEYRRWRRKYPRYPGVAECARLIRARKAKGEWADIIASELAENAREIGDVAGQLYDRAAKFGEDLARAGRGLKTAVDAFNAAVGSFERRLLPMGQKLEFLKVAERSKRRLEAPSALPDGPRPVTAGQEDETPEEE